MQIVPLSGKNIECSYQIWRGLHGFDCGGRLRNKSNAFSPSYDHFFFAMLCVEKELFAHRLSYSACLFCGPFYFGGVSFGDEQFFSSAK